MTSSGFGCILNHILTNQRGRRSQKPSLLMNLLFTNTGLSKTCLPSARQGQKIADDEADRKSILAKPPSVEKTNFPSVCIGLAVGSAPRLPSLVCNHLPNFNLEHLSFGSSFCRCFVFLLCARARRPHRSPSEEKSYTLNSACLS